MQNTNFVFPKDDQYYPQDDYKISYFDENATGDNTGDNNNDDNNNSSNGPGVGQAPTIIQSGSSNDIGAGGAIGITFAVVGVAVAVAFLLFLYNRKKTERTASERTNLLTAEGGQTSFIAPGPFEKKPVGRDVRFDEAANTTRFIPRRAEDAAAEEDGAAEEAAAAVTAAKTEEASSRAEATKEEDDARKALEKQAAAAKAEAAKAKPRPSLAELKGDDIQQALADFAKKYDGLVKSDEQPILAALATTLAQNSKILNAAFLEAAEEKIREKEASTTNIVTRENNVTAQMNALYDLLEINGIEERRALLEERNDPLVKIATECFGYDPVSLERLANLVDTFHDAKVDSPHRLKDESLAKITKEVVSASQAGDGVKSLKSFTDHLSLRALTDIASQNPFADEQVIPADTLQQQLAERDPTLDTKIYPNKAKALQLASELSGKLRRGEGISEENIKKFFSEVALGSKVSVTAGNTPTIGEEVLRRLSDEDLKDLKERAPETLQERIAKETEARKVVREMREALANPKELNAGENAKKALDILNTKSQSKNLPTLELIINHFDFHELAKLKEGATAVKYNATGWPISSRLKDAHQKHQDAHDLRLAKRIAEEMEKSDVTDDARKDFAITLGMDKGRSDPYQEWKNQKVSVDLGKDMSKTKVMIAEFRKAVEDGGNLAKSTTFDKTLLGKLVEQIYKADQAKDGGKRDTKFTDLETGMKFVETIGKKESAKSVAKRMEQLPPEEQLAILETLKLTHRNKETEMHLDLLEGKKIGELKPLEKITADMLCEEIATSPNGNDAVAMFRKGNNNHKEEATAFVEKLKGASKPDENEIRNFVSEHSPETIGYLIDQLKNPADHFLRNEIFNLMDPIKRRVILAALQSHPEAATKFTEFKTLAQRLEPTPSKTKKEKEWLARLKDAKNTKDFGALVQEINKININALGRIFNSSSTQIKTMSELKTYLDELKANFSSTNPGDVQAAKKAIQALGKKIAPNIYNNQEALEAFGYRKDQSSTFQKDMQNLSNDEAINKTLDGLLTVVERRKEFAKLVDLGRTGGATKPFEELVKELEAVKDDQALGGKKDMLKTAWQKDFKTSTGEAVNHLAEQLNELNPGGKAEDLEKVEDELKKQEFLDAVDADTAKKLLTKLNPYNAAQLKDVLEKEGKSTLASDPKIKEGMATHSKKTLDLMLKQNPSHPLRERIIKER